jgi:nicotinic acid mononucleotide adenylyltransferase
LEIVEDAFSDIDGVIVSNFEVKNSRATFTVETYLELSKKYNINHIIVGADNLETLSKWRDFDFLNSRVTWIIAKRGEKDIECSLLKRCILLDIDVDVSSSEIRDGKKLHLIDKKIQKRVRDEYRIREKS